MNLSETMKKLVAAKAEVDAGVDIDSPPHLIAGRELRLNEAKVVVRDLTIEVRNMVQYVSGGIFVGGPGAQKFADIAADEGNAIVVDGGLMYRELADAADKCLNASERNWRFDVLQAMFNVMTKYADRLGIRWMKPMNATKYIDAHLETYAQVLAVVYDMVDEALGDDLNVMLLRDDIVRKVIETEHDKQVIPVVVLGLPPAKFAPIGAALFQGRFITVNTKEEVEKNDVITAFKHLKPHFIKKT
jgi:hypothetical protein